MKKVYVILAFHAHELLWDLPETLLSYLDGNNPMKEGITGENYLKKRKEEGRDVYSLCSDLGDKLNAPMCVEYTNELLVQIKDVMPKVFDKLSEDYKRGRLYPLYGHAHHTHVSLLQEEELVQEINWNREYLHQVIKAPYPKYQGLFPTEDSLSFTKMSGIKKANIDYVIFPHLEEGKAAFEIMGRGDCTYKPFIISTPFKKILALPRNFPISQEIWRPITKMKRDEVKSQGYMLGDFPVFNNEYLTGNYEKYPISFAEGVELYKEVLRRELSKAPDEGLLLYVQDLELMDFGDIALDIMEKAWLAILAEDESRYNIKFISPDEYIEELLEGNKLDSLPFISFKEISWAPEIRLILRADGHYPPLSVTGVGAYDNDKTGIYKHPHVFWENGKYFCGIFDELLNNLGISLNVPADIKSIGQKEYDLAKESINTQAVMYLRIMKRACNWGWRPTEGRQKRPCLLGYLLCDVLQSKLEESPANLILNKPFRQIDERNFIGLCEVLKVFIDNRIEYLKYGLEEYRKEHEYDLSSADKLIKSVLEWKGQALNKGKALYLLNRNGLDNNIQTFIGELQGYCQAVYMATDFIQQIWGVCPDSEYMVDKMYHYLYRIYPPLFPAMIDRIDTMNSFDIDNYFQTSSPRA